jgi:integrase
VFFQVHRCRGSQRGMRKKRVAPFTLYEIRQTFISSLLDAGADIAMVPRLAGHEDPAITSRYDRRDEAAKQPASELVRVPYGPHKASIGASNSSHVTHICG